MQSPTERTTQNPKTLIIEIEEAIVEGLKYATKQQGGPKYNVHL